MTRAPDASDRTVESPSLEGIAVQYVEQWLSQCETFRQWYRQHFYLQTPGEEDGRLADEIQPWMIRMTRALLAPMLDPEFLHRRLARAVEATLWQLEEDWDSRRNPMPDAEVDALLKAHFPPSAS
ncbi:MAG: hypothetical protein HY735_24610 [Verrucomicrobia bacterium]|nr:hypothetical protein [Verrucomicrobiota bacterium]